MTAAETSVEEAPDLTLSPWAGRLQLVRVGADVASRRWWATVVRHDAVGLSVAFLFVCLSLTPSLLPRGPVFQGWLSGIVAASGYGIGVLAHRTARHVVRVHVPAAFVRWTRVTVAAGGPGAVGGFLVAGRQWQREAHRLVGQPEPGPLAPLVIVALMVTGFTGLVGAARLARILIRTVRRRLTHRLPAAIAGAASVLVVGLAVAVLVDQVLMRTAVMIIDDAFSASNDSTEAGARQPATASRSGSPASLVAWDHLGREGRNFVSEGPSVSELTSFAGRPAMDPVRVYVGLESAGSIRERSRIAVAELERTGAFERKVLCVVTTTGTGWVDPQAARALEYLYAGDTAIVATQYSYLPSPLSFLLDDRRSERAGAELFDQVYRAWSARPPEHRPRLVVFGESLGTNGGQVVFDAAGTARPGVAGALFVGPPGSNGLWRGIVDDRDPGSSERLPTFREGASVRFADDRGDLPDQLGAAGTNAWSSPRVLFLQHASDPIVWWSPDLLFQRPDWLTENREDDVSRSMGWYPVVTFWQVTADLVAANGVPPGSGHRYDDLIPAAWAAIVPPGGWTAADTQRLERTLATV